MNASACAKLILLGEHAVVYGVPAIAVPLPALRAHVAVVAADRFSIASADRRLALTAGDEHPFIHLARQLALDAGCALPAITLEVSSQIPIASGLGSGAAIATAIGRAMLLALNHAVSRERLNELVYESERFYHGTPSGIDNTVIVYETPVFFQRNEPIRTLTDFHPITLVIAGTGVEAPTRAAVADVRCLYDADPARLAVVFDEIRDCVQSAYEAMQRGCMRQLGAALTRNHVLLQTLTVSSPQLDRLVAAALDAGALGAKLSGGGRGGVMIALVQPPAAAQVAAALTAVGAVWALHVEVAP